jgi:hypothetical protein
MDVPSMQVVGVLRWPCRLLLRVCLWKKLRYSKRNVNVSCQYL